MIVILFDNGVQLLGGYGDRIVGIVACKVMADLLNRSFRIVWEKENVRKYITYPEYEYDKEGTSYTYNLIDQQTKIKEYLMKETIIFPTDITKFYLNQEISQYMYKNQLYKDNDYFHDIFNVYKNLYTDILKPTDYVQSIVNQIVPNNIYIVGIQIRAGDCYMSTNRGETHLCIQNPEVTIKTILERIKTHINKSNYAVFVTSDYINIFNLAKQVFQNVLYYNKTIQHIDRNPVDNDISKVFIDSYILSQYTDKLYISSYSNFGRVSALSSKHDEIYDFNCNKLDAKTLLSKHENY